MLAGWVEVAAGREGLEAAAEEAAAAGMGEATGAWAGAPEERAEATRLEGRCISCRSSTVAASAHSR